MGHRRWLKNPEMTLNGDGAARRPKPHARPTEAVVPSGGQGAEFVEEGEQGGARVTVSD